jgi:hypothetical protein
MATATGAAAPCTEKQRALVVALAEDASPSQIPLAGRRRWS